MILYHPWSLLCASRYLLRMWTRQLKAWLGAIIAILEVFRLLVQLKASHFEPTLDCSQAGPCNFDGAGKGCVIFLAQRTMALKDYWKMARCYEMPFTFGSHTGAVFFARHSLPYSQPKTIAFRSSILFIWRSRWDHGCIHVSDASHLCTKQRLTRSSPCELFWSRLANGEVARLVRFSDLSTFWQKQGINYFVYLSIAL